MEITYRKALKNDCPQLLKLIHELAVYEKAPDEVTVTLDTFEVSGFGENPIWKAFVAEHENEGVIGFALYYIRYSTWKGPRIYLEDFLVTDKYRGSGVGKVLFELVLKESIKAPYTGMVWQVLNWNEPALNFYRKYNANLEREWLNGSLNKDQIERLI